MHTSHYQQSWRQGLKQLTRLLASVAHEPVACATCAAWMQRTPTPLLLSFRCANGHVTTNHDYMLGQLEAMIDAGALFYCPQCAAPAVIESTFVAVEMVCPNAHVFWLAPNLPAAPTKRHGHFNWLQAWRYTRDFPHSLVRFARYLMWPVPLHRRPVRNTGCR